MKTTPIGEIPEDWEVVKVEKLFDFQRGYSYRKNDISEKPTQLRFVTINDFEKEGGLKKNTEKIYLREDLKIDKKYFVEGSALLIANTDMSKGLIIGAPLLISQQKGEEQIVFSMDLTRLIPKKENISLEYIFYLLLSPSMRRIMKAFAQGTNVLHLNHTLVKGLKIPLPPLPEQKKIAEILRTVDEAIEKTDLAIEKTERLMKGLMQRLLTRGIKHERFKKTEIGEIPDGWEVIKLKEVVKIRGNKTIKGIEKVAIIPMELVPDSRIFTKYKVVPIEQVKSSTYCEAGDILLAKITPSLENGKQGIVPFGVPNGFALATTEVFPIAPDENKIDRFFLFYLLKFDRFRRKIIASMTGTTGRQRASKKAVENLLIPLPPLSEQKKIAEILSTVDKKFELLRKRKEKLEKIKKGLMRDLLTGRRRVRV